MDKLIKRNFKDFLPLSLKSQANSSVTKTQSRQKVCWWGREGWG